MLDREDYHVDGGSYEAGWQAGAREVAEAVLAAITVGPMRQSGGAAFDD